MSGIVPLTVNFVGSGTDPDGRIISYYWNFGDGSFTDSPCPSHTFTNEGTYSITFNVTDNNGSAGSCSLQIHATTATNHPPNASISADSITGTIPFTVSFKGSGTDVDGYIMSYYWDFGDGSNSALQNISHTFTKVGNYNVTLTIIDNHEAIDTCSLQITCNPTAGNLTQSGKNYVCEQYGDANHCVVSEGLVFSFTDDKNQTYTELTGGTTDILGFLMMGIVQSITMNVPSRPQIQNPLQEFLDVNGGMMLGPGDVALFFEHDENSTNQWCYIPIK
jgi:PKD repeat protein